MDTFPNLLRQQSRSRSGDVAIRFKRYGIWQTWTWQQAEANVQKIACGLAAKGLKPDDIVAVLGNNIPQLYFTILATQCLGAVPATVHPDSTAKELTDTLCGCDAKFAIVQDQQQVDALLLVKRNCPKLVHVFYVDGRGMQAYDKSHLSSVADLEKMGEKFNADHPSFFNDVTGKVNKDATAFIAYTSGTTNHPRGAMLSHANFIATGQSVIEHENIGLKEEVLAYLPLSYSTHLLFSYTLWLMRGFTLSCPESGETIMNDIREVGPTFMFGPPHFYKRIYGEVVVRLESSGSWLYKVFSKVMHANHDKVLGGHALSVIDSFKAWVGDLLVFGPLKNVYGLSRVKLALCGGDAISSEVFTFFRALRINLKKSYGTTESAGCIAIQSDRQLGTRSGEFVLGKPLKNVEVKALADGQLAFKGVNTFLGYCNNAVETNRMRDNQGWALTGDMGSIDHENHIHVLDRVENIGKLKTGDVFIPKPIENELKASPYIRDAVVIGDGHDALVALIVIDKNTIISWADAQNIRYTGYEDLASKVEVYELVKKRIDEVNANIENIVEHRCPPIKRFSLLNRELDVESGELTRTRKVRREVVMGRHQALVQALYSSQERYEVKDKQSGATLVSLRLASAQSK